MSAIADNVTVGGINYSTDDVTTLNGGAVSAGSSHTQRIKVQYGDDSIARDVSTAFPMPITMVSSGGLATTVGTISAAGSNVPGTPATSSTTGAVVASTALAGNATFHVVTSAFVGTLIFEGSVDAGLNYAPLIAIREDGTGSESSVAISTAAYFIRQYTVALPGYAYFRVRASAFTSGTAAVIIAPGPTLIEPNPTLAAGANQIGTLGEFRASPLLVSATGAPTVAATCTLPAAGAGLFHYITSLTAELYSTAARTGGASPIIVTSTNLPGTPGWTLPSAGAIGVVDRVSMPLTTPLKSSAANTATVITGPATTSGSWRINVAYFVGV